ncbi:hypothetical protein [Cellulosimicrobium sp. Marseille-Q4280]|uniref:hypothetical protein n=1 Tax=Cellulosimicrobium sp. Marseille-Q4280 TaxID=2937992 RepID=UPI002042534D|nr:hypothetical protein [Cellulosimicrobium sp. Marseille-Q4280]
MPGAHQARIDTVLGDYRTAAQLADALGLSESGFRSRRAREAQRRADLPDPDRALPGQIATPAARVLGLEVWHVDQVDRMLEQIPHHRAPGRPKGAGDVRPRRRHAPAAS